MTTKMVAVKDLSAGSILGESVLTASGKTLLGKDIVLTERIIALLYAWDVKNVYVSGGEEAPGSSPEEPGEYDGPPISEDYLKFFQEYDAVVTMTTQSFDFIRKQKLVPLQYIKETSATIYSSLLNNGPALTHYLLVSDYRLADDLSRHSVMVAYIAGLIARQMRLSEEEVKAVTMAGLLHDIGKLAINKTEALRPHTHITEGAALLREVKGLCNDVILGVLQHHECVDGSGFPTGVEGPRIHPYAKVIAVADTFHSQAYRDENANPFPVLDMLSQEMFGRLDPAVCHVFIARVRDCLLRTKVLLSDGREAEVIYFQPTGSSLPIVRTADGQIINLANYGSVKIKRILLPYKHAS